MRQSQPVSLQFGPGKLTPQCLGKCLVLSCNVFLGSEFVVWFIVSTGNTIDGFNPALPSPSLLHPTSPHETAFLLLLIKYLIVNVHLEKCFMRINKMCIDHMTRLAHILKGQLNFPCSWIDGKVCRNQSLGKFRNGCDAEERTSPR
jgi:hypothetical protein